MDGTRKRQFHAPTVAVDRVVITEGIEVRPGVPLTIVTERDPVDPISRDLASGVYSPQYDRLLGLLQTIVPVGGRVLDLGAHIGTFSLAAAALGYEVLAVEASPQNAALLQASIEANGFRQMRVIHAAVSDRSGVLEFCAIGPWGHVSTPLLTTPTVRVPAVTVEQILDDHGWDRVDFVKIDIEGSEVAALEGMKQLLSGPDSPPLFVESNGHTLNFFDQTPDTLKKTLKRYGYQAFLVEHESLVPVKEGELQPDCCVDLLVLKRRPVGLREFRIDRPLSRSEIIARVLYSCRAENPAVRWYIARALRTASRSIRGHKDVIQAVSALRLDPDMSICDAAAKVRTGDSGMSRWFTWRRTRSLS